MLNYSDKTISKWENGDSLARYAVLAALTDIYGITLDDLVHANAAEDRAATRRKSGNGKGANRLIILCLTVSVVFLIATLVFVYLKLKANITYWQAFVWAGARVLLISPLVEPKVGNGRKMSKIYRTAVLSVLCWSFLAAVYLQLLEYQVWLIFILGIPIELIIWLSSKLNKWKSPAI